MNEQSSESRLQADIGHQSAELNVLVDDLRQLVAGRQIVAVVGTGVTRNASGDAPVASWVGLLHNGIARCLELRQVTPEQADKMHAAVRSGTVDALLDTAESVTTLLGGQTGGEYSRWLRESVGALTVKKPAVLEALSDLNVPIATTNYDGLLEEVTGWRPVTWQDRARVERVLRGDEQGVLHLHGYWEEPRSVVLGIRSYDQVTADPHAQAALRALRMTYSLLFIGFGAGLDDPNFGALLRWSREVFAGSEYRQFRLARASEVEALQQQHPSEERIFVVPYGESHDDLAPFLRNLGDPQPQPLADLSAVGGFGHPLGGKRAWRVPHPRNTVFTGREGLVAELRTAFGEVSRQGKTPSSIVAIYGLGGVGKTQIAVEYAYRYADAYDVVWWIRTEQASTLAADFAALARELGLPEAAIQAEVTTIEAMSQAQVANIEAVRRWLERKGQRWLLVLDNADHPDSLDEYIPLVGDGHVLITSRDAIWPAWAKSVAVPVLPSHDAVAFLLNRTGQHNGATAAVLAEELGFLPLALEQAGAYVVARGLTLDRYLERFRTQRREVLQRGEPSDYGATVATTWQLSFQGACEQAPGAAGLLNFMAFLDADAIPLEILSGQGTEMPDSLRVISGNPIALDDAVVALRRYSLVEAVDDWTLSVHRLVQAVTYDRLPEDQQRVWAATAVRAIVAALPEEGHDPRTWPSWERLLPHMIAVVRHCDELCLADQWVAVLNGRVGVHLSARGRSAEARPMLERSLAIVEAEQGPDDPELANGLHHYARVLMDLADLAAAQQAVERALAIDESVHGADHLEAANDLGLMGNILRQQGRLREAQEKHERALAIRETVLGPDDPQVATSLNDLGNVLRQRGDSRGARRLHERALQIHEAALGPDHPEVAVDLGNLGQDLHRLGDLALARERQEQALALNEKLYSTDHPMVATVLGNLGRVLRAENKLAEARQRHERARVIDEAAYGPDHPHVATDLGNLGDVLQAAGNLTEAKPLYERALTILEAAYGPNHPRVASAENNLATLLERQHDLAAARAGFERAIAIDEATLGNDHMAIATYAFNLANMLQQEGALVEAIQLLERALRIHEATESADRDLLTQALSLLADLHMKQGNLSEARRAFQKLLPVWRSVGDEQSAGGVLRSLRRIDEQERGRRRNKQRY